VSHEPSIDARRLRDAIAAAGLRLGTPLTWIERTESTNDVAAREAASGAPHGATFLAEQQTGGRGRLGRKWFSPPGQNLYLSIVLRPDVPAERLPCITLAIGLAVAEAITPFVPGIPVEVKWPNDVLIARRKAVGILVEASTTGAGAMTLVAGIGINVLQTAFDPEIEGIATSIAAHGPRPERAQVLLAVLERLSVRLEQFERDGLSGMLGELRARDATLGRRVRCASGEGLGAGIFDDGALRVQTAAGEMIRVQAGEVEILRA